jgi:hypothetical protein
MPTKDDGPNSLGTDSVVHIDAKSRTFELLLQYLSGEDPSTRSKNFYESQEELVSFWEMEDVLELGERFGVSQLPRMVLPFMRDHARMSINVWEVFKFAAKNDLPLLASYALRQLQRSGYPEQKVADINHRMLEEVPARYLVPLIRNMTLFRKADGETDWEKVARNYPHLEKVSLMRLVRLTKGSLWLRHPASSPTLLM